MAPIFPRRNTAQFTKHPRVYYMLLVILVSRATDYKITLVFRLKAQSRAMGNTADT